MKYLFALMVLILLNACSTASLNKLQVGMSKDEAVKIMGSPNSRSANANGESYIYSLYDRVGGPYEDYFVNFQDGQLVGFGKAYVDPQVQAASVMARQSALNNAANNMARPQPVPYMMPVRQPVNCTSNRVGNSVFTNCN